MLGRRYNCIMHLKKWSIGVSSDPGTREDGDKTTQCPTMRKIGVMICVRRVVVDRRNEDNISQNGVVDKKDKQHS